MALPEEPEKPPNHERWIISYADFTTLLLATFVVMYAVSSINSSKFQEMAEAFNTAFMGHTVQIQSSGFAAGHKSPFNFMPSPVHVPIITRDVVPDKDLPVAPVQKEAEHANPNGSPDATIPGSSAPTSSQQDSKSAPQSTPSPAQTVILEPAAAASPGGGQEGRSGSPQPPGWARQSGNPAGGQQGQAPSRTHIEGQGMPIGSPELRDQIERRVQQLDRAFDRLKQALAPLIGSGEVRVSLSSLGVVIDINEVLLFNSGKAELTPQALPLIDRVAGILKGLPYQIQVNGFTDTVPIHTAQFDSNWDLSATRAISVVKRFVTAGIDPEKLVGAGFGEYHPVAANSTPEGKSMNRRVSVVVVSPVQGDNPMKTPMLGTPQSRSEALPSAMRPAVSSVP